MMTDGGHDRGVCECMQRPANLADATRYRSAEGNASRTASIASSARPFPIAFRS